MTNSQVQKDSGGGNPAQARSYGQYVLVRKLAEGGMAEIFLAKRLGADGFERNVVIKRMLPNLSSQQEFVEMFRDEARLAARLVHPNIIQIQELGFVEGCYFICMEYLPGEDFSTTVRTASQRRQYVPVPLVLYVLAEAARGLHYAHEFTDDSGQPLNVVHRDVSPSNLYVTYQGQVKVLDFGIAKAESRLTQTRAGVVKGKYTYMAPEQARGLEVDRRADVFSLGVSLYEALTLVRPFAREHELAVLNAVLKGDFKPPRALRPDLSPELEAVVLKAMALNREERYPTAAAFAEDLELLMAQELPPPTGASLASFLRSTFGEERYAEKTRIPTLPTLMPGGARVQVQPDSHTGPLHSTQHAPASPQADKAPQTASMSIGGSRRKALLLGAVAGVLLLAGGAFLLGRVLTPPPPPSAVAPSAVAPSAVAPSAMAPQPAPPPAATAVASPSALLPANQQPPPEPPSPAAAPDTEQAVAQAEPPMEKPQPAQEPQQPRTVKARPVELSAEYVQRKVSDGRARMESCFEQHKSSLPSNEGEVKVRFVIYSSGRTKAYTQGPLARTAVGQCLERQLERLRFPAHRDGAVEVNLPFAYRVAR